MMQSNLALLELELSRIQSIFVEGFDGVDHVGVDIHRGINHAISADAQD
jgi:hypothetical protein